MARWFVAILIVMGGRFNRNDCEYTLKRVGIAAEERRRRGNYDTAGGEL